MTAAALEAAASAVVGPMVGYGGAEVGYSAGSRYGAVTQQAASSATSSGPRRLELLHDGQRGAEPAHCMQSATLERQKRLRDMMR